VKRTVFCEDAIEWLKACPVDTDSSFVASLPDISEFPQFKLEKWSEWFVDTASLIFSRCADNAFTIFYQSDIKLEGKWIDKGYLCMKAAEGLRHELLFHKVICRAPVNTVTFGRPAYSHLLCFSKAGRLIDLSQSTADVLDDPGDKTWIRGMGLKTALAVAQFIAKQNSNSRFINPFCGEGSILAAANHVGLEAIGIERSPKRAEKARKLMVSAEGKEWIQ
jgi:hypothetical protein